MINTSQLLTDLQTKINALTGTESAEQILALTAAVNNLTANRYLAVSTYSQLPDLTTNPMPSGTLVFLENVNVMIVAIGTQWKGLDGRTLIGGNLAITYGWGDASSGQLGDGTTTSRSVPTAVSGSVTNWSNISAGTSHSLAITSTGIAYAWGNNDQGRLGDNTTTIRSSPVTVVGGITTWSQIAAGSSHSLGITSDGIAYAWGSNSTGQLGDNTTSNRSSPVTVVGGITTWSKIAGGRDSSFGITSAGILYSWGSNAYGRLGDNTTSSRLSPVTVVGGITTWNQVSSGFGHTVGVTTGGVAYAWGYNFTGQLGDNSTTSRSSPVSVIGGITTWSQLSAGHSHTLGITSGGVAYAWGRASYGRLGDGQAITNRSSPVTVVGGITNWSSVAAGGTNSVGLTAEGVIYTWGRGDQGQLGNGTTTSRSSPGTISGELTGWTKIATGIVTATHNTARHVLATRSFTV